MVVCRVVYRRLYGSQDSRNVQQEEDEENLEGHGDLVSRSIMGIFEAIIWLIGVINLLAKSP